MALARRPSRCGLHRSLRSTRQVLSWALARSPGPRRRAWVRLASSSLSDHHPTHKIGDRPDHLKQDHLIMHLVVRVCWSCFAGNKGLMVV
jgi:hypothetical protein